MKKMSSLKFNIIRLIAVLTILFLNNKFGNSDPYFFDIMIMMFVLENNFNLNFEK